MSNIISSYLETIKSTSLIYGLGALIVNICGLFIITFITNYYSPTEMGMIELIFLVINLIIAILTFGLDQTQSYYFFNKDKNTSEKILINNITFIKFLCTLITLLFFLIFYKNISNFFFGYNINLKLYLLIFIIAFLMNFASHYLAIYRLRLNAFRYIFYNIFEALIRLVLIFIFISFLHRNIDFYFYAFLISYLFIFLFILIEFKNYFFTFNLNIELIKNLIKYSLPIIPLAFLWLIISMTDRLFINHFLGLYQLGLYAIAIKFALGINLIIDIFQKSFWSISMKLINQSRDVYNSFFNEILKYYFTIAVISIYFLNIISEYFFFIFTGPNFNDGYKIFNIIILQVFLFGLFHITSMGMWRKDKNFYILVSIFVTLIFNIFLNYILIPLYGLNGAAIATVLSFLILNIISFIFSFFIIKLNIEKNFILKFFPLGSIIIFFIYSGQFSYSNLILIFLNFTLVFLAFKKIIFKFYSDLYSKFI